jgi:hypothetical protein
VDGGAVGYAVAAALCIALGSALQHQAVAVAGGRPSGVGLVVRLTRNGRWMVGLAVTGAGTLLHAAALRNGALAVVEPVLVMNLALALPARALLDRARPSAAHAAAALVLGVGVALFVVAARPSAGHSAADTGVVGVLILAGVTLAGLCTAVAAKSGSERIPGAPAGLAARAQRREPARGDGLRRGRLRRDTRAQPGGDDGRGSWPGHRPRLRVRAYQARGTEGAGLAATLAAAPS